VSQLSWTVLDDVGGKFHVGIYHGQSSGHLVSEIDGIHDNSYIPRTCYRIFL